MNRNRADKGGQVRPKDASLIWALYEQMLITSIIFYPSPTITSTSGLRDYKGDTTGKGVNIYVAG